MRHGGTSCGIDCSHCGDYHEWNELSWDADDVNATWTWLCPATGRKLRMDPYHPALDTPLRDAQEASGGSEGVGIPDRAYASL